MKRSLVNLFGSIVTISLLGVGCGDNEPNNPGGDGDVTTGDGDGDTGAGAPGDGDGDGDGLCTSPHIACGESCTNTASDPANCGECGTKCGANEGCSDGECQRFGCTTGQVECDGACVDLQRNPEFCGSCDIACSAGEVCSKGSCSTKCIGSELACNGSCIDPNTDDQFCGATLCTAEAGMGGAGSVDEGQVCGAGEKCSEGSCVADCTAGSIVCDGACIDPLKNRDFCGATTCLDAGTSGVACASGEVCVEGACETDCPGNQLECEGTCIDAATDESYCGATACGDDATDGTRCDAGERCVGGTCTISCSVGKVVCDGACVDPLKDREFCGATTCEDAGSSGQACDNGEVCINGSCAVSCPADQIACGGTCVDAETDENYCGASGSCDDDASNGVTCGTSELCINGACEVSCGNNLLACENSCIDPLGDPEHCGATDCSTLSGMGIACNTNETCVVGECRVFVPEFTPGQRVDTPVNTVFQDPSVATDPSGNAIAVWRQATSGNTFSSNRLFASYFDKTSKTWSPQVEITTADVDVRNVEIAMSNTGDAIAAWVEGGVGTVGSPIVNRLLVSFYDGSNKVWSSPEELVSASNAATIDMPFVVIDGSSDALIVWAQGAASVANTTQIFNSVYDATSKSFSSPTAFPRGSAVSSNASTYYPRAAINDSGDAAVIWQEYSPTGVTAVAVVGDISSSTPNFTAPFDLKGQPIVGDPDSHDIGIDNAGNVTAVYSAYDNVYFNQALYKRRYNGSWSAPHVTELTGTPGVALNEGDPQSSYARVSVQGSGNVWVAFLVQGYSDFDPYYIPPYAIYGLSFASGVWSDTPVKLSSDSTVADHRPQPAIASDSSGNVFVSWVRHSSTAAFAETIRYNAGSGLWDAAPTQLNSTTLIGGAVSPGLAVANGGNAFVSWVQQDSGATHLFVGRFD